MGLYHEKYYEIVAHALLIDRHELCRAAPTSSETPLLRLSATRFNLYFDPYDLFMYWLLLPPTGGGQRNDDILWTHHDDERYKLGFPGCRWSSYAIAREDYEEASPELEAEERAVVA